MLTAQKPTCFQQAEEGGAHPPLISIHTPKPLLSTQNFQYSQYYTINTVMNYVKTGKAQMTVQQDGICCSSTKYHWTKTGVGGAQMHWGSG